MRADAAVKQCRLFVGIAFDRQAAQQQKAPAVFELMLSIGEKAVNARNGKLARVIVWAVFP